MHSFILLWLRPYAFILLLINVRFLKGKLCFYAAQRQCQETNCWQFWRKVLSLHRERITCNASWDGSGWHKIVVDRRARQVWITLTVTKKKNLPCKKVFKITIKLLPRSLTRICSQLICVSIIFSVYTKPMVSSFFAQHTALHAIFHCFGSLRWNKRSLSEIITYCSKFGDHIIYLPVLKL